MNKEERSNKTRKYDEFEEGVSKEVSKIGHRKPVYLNYDSSGRLKKSIKKSPSEG